MTFTSRTTSRRDNWPFISKLCTCTRATLQLLAEILDEGTVSSAASLSRIGTMPRIIPLNVSFVRNSSISSKEYFDFGSFEDNVQNGRDIDSDSPASSVSDSCDDSNSVSGCDSQCSNCSVGSSDVSNASFVDSLRDFDNFDQHV